MNDQLLQQLKELEIDSAAAQYILEKIADGAIPRLKKLINKSPWNAEAAKSNSNKKNKKEKPPKVVFISSEEEILEQFLYNIKWSKQWCDEIKFRDSNRAKRINEVFVKLDFYLTPRRVHLDSLKEQRLPLEKALDFNNRNFVILGGPGAGKTTLAKFVTGRLFADNESLGKRFSFPFVIRLRDVSSRFHNEQKVRESLYYILIEQFGINLEFGIPKASDNPADGENRSFLLGLYYSIVKRVVTEFIEGMGALIILEGFDEIPNNELKKEIAKEIGELSLSLRDSNFLLTSRTGEFDISVEHSNTFELCSLTDSQIQEFVGKWIIDEEKSKDLYNQIINSPFSDTTIRPLNIAHLCALYERYQNIPDRPKSVYKKIVQLLVEDWDAQRALQRKSQYSNFTSDRKAEFLAKLSFVLTTQLQKSVFDENHLQLAYSRIHSDFELPSNEIKQVLREIESHNGLLIQSGFDKFEFSHKSLQEYLCAEYIVRTQMSIHDRDMVVTIPNELAISVAISSNPNRFFAHIILDILRKTSGTFEFLSPFIRRLIIEKPDFTNDPILACSIAEIFTITIMNCLVSEHLKFSNVFSYNQHFENVVETEQLLWSLINSHSNIQASFSNLRNEYVVSQSIIESLETDVKVDSKNQGCFNAYKLIIKDGQSASNFPYEIFVNSFMLSLIKPINKKDLL